ncbi:nSTAND1 domain-containing NTPase [Nocardiopsis lambiniae]|uniref:Trypsin-like peptidase domain-containing protein n=1 Tax=Nocardiopsis lambiniae TaxID=3075539 RepID=A0ABU2M4C5_9ACTN|nr:trypsin-like peptidase domain-containing protein [Nocardiopsis sp. DSM 44743]MDT0327005.1 trypsin-like peptidase domain-containing protein [Nocardiopsis sp. DSM 44743]
MARIRGEDGAVCGAGTLIAPDLVLTCAHVVSDALGRSRQDEVAAGAVVMVDFPLAEPLPDGPGQWVAEVEQWRPIRPNRTGDVALLRLREAVSGARPLPMAEPEDVWEHGARAVGFTSGEPTTLWFRGKFGGATEEGWIQLSRADGQAAYVKKGFSGSPVWDNELGAAVGLVVAAQPEQDAQQVYVLRTRTLLREIPELAALLLPPTPFRGLATLKEDDADVFFGRDADVDEAVVALQGTHPVVTVYGPSGCGKSSLVLAGVVPRMRQEGYEVLVVDAGGIASPKAALATKLFDVARSERYGPARASSLDQIEQWLDDSGLPDAFHHAAGGQAERLLVVLDQAEALLNRSAPEIAQAVALLFPEHQPVGLRVIVTLRADFMDATLSHAQLGPVLKRGVTLPLTPMTRDQLHEVITEPLRRIPAVEYDPGLERRILDDAGDEPGILPLLGFVLKELWERRAVGRLQASVYEDLGGVSGALRGHAEEAWRTCVRPGDEAEARLLLTGLVRVLPGGEAPLRRILTREEAGDKRWRLVQALAERRWRLLVLYGGDGQPESAELSHEALIAAWPALADEVRASAGFLAARAEVQHDLERWRHADSPADLLTGTQLAALEGRLRGREADLTGEQREFLAQARRRRMVLRRRAWTAWTAGVLALVLIAGLLGFYIQESNVSAQRTAEGWSRALAIQSDELMASNPSQAVLVALAAYEIAPTQEARSSLMRRYEEFQDAAWTLSGAEGMILGAAMSADGAVTLVTTEGGRATLFVRTTEGEVRQEQLRLAENVLSPVVSRDGRRIAYTHDADGTVVWHDVMPSGQQMVGPPHRLQGALEERSLGAWVFGDIKILDFSPDARRLVGVSAVDSEQPTRIWDLETGRYQLMPENVTRLSDVWFGPDENTLVAIHSPDSDPLSIEYSIVVVDIDTGMMSELASGIESESTGVSGDGSIVVVCQEVDSNIDFYREAHYQARRVADGKVLSDYIEEGESCENVNVTAAGERFVIRDIEGGWNLVDISTRQGRAMPFFGPTNLSGIAHLPLLGTAREPVLVTRKENGITGWALVEETGGTAYGFPELLGDGGTMVVRVGSDGDKLHVIDTENNWKILAEADISASAPPDTYQSLALNDTETLVADVSDQNRITVRSLPSLRRVTEFAVTEPLAGENELQELLQYRFLNDEQLVTTSGSLIEHWDAHEGRRLSPPIDLNDLRLTTKEQPHYFVGRHPAPGHVGVTVRGEPDVHAVNLSTGEENKELRIQLGPDLNVAVFLEDPRYAAVMTTGGMVELWSVLPGQNPERVVGPLGPLNPDQWTADLTGGTGFFLANNSSVHFLQADDPGHRETYQFAKPQTFIAAASNGQVLLRSSEGRLGLFRLDPDLWKRHLCSVVGRDLTSEERSYFPTNSPIEICT